MTTWPNASIDTVTRFRALSAAVAGAHVAERFINAPFDDVWAYISDLEGGFGDIEPDMRNIHVRHYDGHRIVAVARSRLGMRALLRGTLRPGWCWLQSRFLIIGIAAQPEGTGTRVAMTGGLRVPGRARLAPLGVRRTAQRSLIRLERHFSPAAIED
ncbi:hypothetical protein [Natronoglycomyces albus]|uniref:Uncharacterized protein n=1 Tax=Natronoglycomyces albus TaxID=2811108 RepID=A0A895XF20_9ACTN|nr:hypothetical protein [Natronoglycomyces albus]QSB03914.1 hypothetical protein JQS30_08750 [Natronoglycomyces albus]